MARKEHSAICERCASKFVHIQRRPQRYCSLRCATKSIDRGTPESRFLAMVDIHPNGCIVWTGVPMRGGYGRIRVNGKSMKAHRYSWELSNGPLPEGAWVLHRCDNPPCVNPDHLFLGSPSDNVADMVEKKRHRFGERVSNSKLTADEIRAIRASKLTQQETANQFGISQANVSSIQLRKAWKHVE